MSATKVGILTERMIMGYGVDLVVHKTAEGLTRRGFDVKVYCNMFDGTYSDETYEIVRLDARADSRQEYEEAVLSVAGPAVADRDILIAESFPYFRVAYESGKPWVAVDHGVVPSWGVPRTKRGEFEYIRSMQYGVYYRGATRIVCVSNFLRHQLSRELQEKAVVIHPGIDHYPRLFLTNLRDLYGIEEPILLYLGRSTDTSPYKNTDDLLNCYCHLKERAQDLKLVIATACSPKEQARLEKGGALVLTNVQPEFIPSLYASCDVFVTATKWEGFDLPALEASYFGRPVVAYRVGGHLEIIRHEETGFLADTFQQFESFLGRLIADADLRERMGASGEKFASGSFRWSESISKYTSLILGMKV